MKIQAASQDFEWFTFESIWWSNSRLIDNQRKFKKCRNEMMKLLTILDLIQTFWQFSQKLLSSF